MHPGERLVIRLSMRTASFRPRFDMLQLYAQNCPLNSIEPPVPADHIMIILLRLTVFAEHRNLGPQSIAIRHARTALTARAKVFPRIKTETTDIANRPRALALILGAMRLRCIFHHRELVLSRDLHDRVHVSHLAVKMDRDNRFRTRRDSL